MLSVILCVREGLSVLLYASIATTADSDPVSSDEENQANAAKEDDKEVQSPEVKRRNLQLASLQEPPNKQTRPPGKVCVHPIFGLLFLVHLCGSRRSDQKSSAASSYRAAPAAGSR